MTAFVFDVDMAREFVRDGNHEVMELEPEDVVYSVGRCEVNEGHLAHVVPSIPGIVAHIYFPNDDGQLVHGHRLIDGHHRAARCLQHGIPFPIYALSQKESVKILMKAPKGARPGKKYDPETQEARQARKRKKSRRKQAKASKRRTKVA
jgi:hypothetical protein